MRPSCCILHTSLNPRSSATMCTIEGLAEGISTVEGLGEASVCSSAADSDAAASAGASIRQPEADELAVRRTERRLIGASLASIAPAAAVRRDAPCV
eukprot:SAG31_NODE_1074_length_10052_cov_88.255400_5_plen_97_part_00